MSVRNLSQLFKPHHVALIGASERDGSLGRLLFDNLRRGGLPGKVFPINPRHTALCGQVCYPDVAALPEIPDLAVIATPAETVPPIIGDLAARGVRSAVVISAGFGGDQGRTLRKRMLAAARPALMRIVGPNCLGVLAPGGGLNASFAHLQPASGPIAFIAQSGAMITSILDWAAPRGIGFSHLVSLGDMADVDFGDMLDYLADDRETRAILLYIEAITDARKFMSAARAAARSKPVIAVKAGRHAAAARAAASHTGALAGHDAVYEAAFRRAGMLRVPTLEALFDAAETLAFTPALRGERLVIVSNGGGIAVLATDALMSAGGTLAELSPETIAALDGVLPATWSRSNPVDIIGDAPPERYAAAIDAIVDDPQADALLVLNSPTAVTTPTAAAEAVVGALPHIKRRPVLTSWVGDASVGEARARFRDAGLPTYESPEDAVTAFTQLVEYRRNQQALMETPPARSSTGAPDRMLARSTLEQAVEAGHAWLDGAASKAVLSAYGIDTAQARFAPDADAAAALAREVGRAVAVKIASPDLTHKSDIGGVALDVMPEAVAATAGAMLTRIRHTHPDACLSGFTVEPMIDRGSGCELIAGVLDDRQFGPVILFGQGGTAVEVIDDTVVALPPLNLELARDAIARTRVSRLMAGYRDVPAVDIDAVAEVLVRLSDLIVDCPEIIELDINPLLARADGVIALDARIRVAASTVDGADRLAIRPYPRELEHDLAGPDEQVFRLRPIMPEDEPALARLYSRLSPEEVRLRFFTPMKFIDHVVTARFSQIDYDRQMALVLAGQGAPGHVEIHGVVRLIEEPDRARAEFAILVEHELAGHGLGKTMMKHIIAYARHRGIGEIYGDVLADNRRMLALCRELGFGERRSIEEPGVLRVTLTPG